MLRPAAVLVIAAWLAGAIGAIGALGAAPAAAAPAPADDDGAADPKDEVKTGIGARKLVEALRTSPSFKVRATAAVALGRLGDATAATALADALRSDDHYAVRLAAASALGRLPTVDGIPPLLRALHDQDPFVREEAVSSLDRFHTTAMIYAFRDALDAEDPAVRLAAIRAYGDVLRENTALAPFVLAALGDDDKDVAHAAETALAGIPHEKAVPILVGALSTGGSEVRIACARLLKKRADKTAVDPLAALVIAPDESDEVHAAARDALKAHKDYVDVDARKAAAADAAPEAREARLHALRILAVIGDPGAAALIEAALKDAEPAVRVSAARAAADLGDKKLVAAAAARETDPRTKRQLDLIQKSMR